MAKYCGPEDIYKELVEDSEENWLYGLVAFAVVEEQRIEWMKHYQEQHDRKPTSEEANAWYEQQPPSVLLRAKGTAESALQTYSEEVFETAMADQRREIEEGIIVGEIRELKRFWPQFGVNIVGGLASAILFAALLVLVAFFVINDASPVEVGQQLRNTLEVTNHGNEVEKQGSDEQEGGNGGIKSSSQSQ